ncbi:pilus assembly protein PilZ [Bacillus sp. FJAT-42376]|uniref:flagellar brake protein n=1 Tax=Bacillus sp. FJAT-42376 TaxID=2014076 RepID=UPI000F515842|nr:flagellar brake domain-containing protein [Bacillus sp. FJAT-42376]AZB43358.1 pilus assembly protein PilZ [Bacillus sp. FJAT-42376]
MLEIGNLLTLELTDEPGDVYKCKIVSLDEGTFSIDYPLNEKTGKTAFIMNGAMLSCLIVGADQNPYRFETAVMGRKKENIPVIILKKPDPRDLVKIQRRQYVRIDTDVNVAVHSPFNAFEPFVTVTSDLSAGGASLILPKNAGLKEKEQLIVWMAMPLNDGTISYVTIDSESIRIIEDSSGVTKATIKFHDVSETDQQKIVRYCFDQQILHRKKEAAYE